MELRAVDRTSTQQLEVSYRRPSHLENYQSLSGTLFSELSTFSSDEIGTDLDVDDIIEDDATLDALYDFIEEDECLN